MSGPASPLHVLAGLAGKIDQAVKSSPLADVEKNLRAQFIAELANRGLVTREEYDTQVALLEKTRAKLSELEAKIAALEASRASDPR
ncbi:MAG: accessory factor UbiK family protein [Betaproteobacteria bacterium]|nr:accessory factor UbiK family protein [Betaproteobacteria bacterium]